MSKSGLQMGEAVSFDVAPKVLNPVLSVTLDWEAIWQRAAEVDVTRAAVSDAKRTAFSNFIGRCGFL